MFKYIKKQMFKKVKSSYLDYYTLKGLWFSVGYIEFEHKVAELFSLYGYRTEVTPQTNDGGVDVYLYNKKKVVAAVQCKYYVRNPFYKNLKIFINDLKKTRAPKGIFVTTAYYDEPLKFLADANDIRLIDIDKLIEMSQEKNLTWS